MSAIDALTTGHTMRVILAHYRIELIPVCHEPDGAVCRVACPEGCETYDYPGHEHELKPVEWDGSLGYTWSPAKTPAATS